MDFVSWDDDIPNIWKVIKFHGSKSPIRIYIYIIIYHISHQISLLWLAINPYKSHILWKVIKIHGSKPPTSISMVILVLAHSWSPESHKKPKQRPPLRNRHTIVKTQQSPAGVQREIVPGKLCISHDFASKRGWFAIHKAPVYEVSGLFVWVLHQLVVNHTLGLHSNNESTRVYSSGIATTEHPKNNRTTSGYVKTSSATFLSCAAQIARIFQIAKLH